MQGGDTDDDNDVVLWSINYGRDGYEEEDDDDGNVGSCDYFHRSCLHAYKEELAP